MQIEDQIKALQRIKAKIDLYRKIKSNLQEEMASVNQDAAHKALAKEHPELLDEFCEEVICFCEERIESLGNPSKARPANLVAELEVPAKGKSAEVSPPPASVPNEPTDPLKFLLKYRYLDGKKVRFRTKDGEVTGIVRGMVTPYLRIETTTGHNISISPSEVTQDVP